MFRNLKYALSLLVLVGLLVPNARAQDVAGQLEEAEVTAAHRELIQQLGDGSFEARERAERELLRQGMAAQAALTEALKNPDLEIRWRARDIRKRLRENAFEARLAAFIADVDGSRQLSLPGWKQFRDLVGDSRDAREMLAEMTRYEGALLSAYEERGNEMPELFATCVAWLQSQATSANADSRSVPRPSLATLLLIGCDETVKDHAEGRSKLYSLLCQRAAMESIGTQAQPPVLRKLLEQWFVSSGAQYGMTLARKYNLEETGLQLATKLLEEGTTSSGILHQAIITVGRFGGQQHARLLTPLLEDKTVCHRWSNRALKKEGTINVEVRDAALVVLLRLSGKDPKQYGFKLLQDNPETLYHVYTFGFVEDEEREATHAKLAADFKADAE